MHFTCKITVLSISLLISLFSFASASQYPSGGQIFYSRSGTVIGTPYYNLTQSQFTWTLPGINPGVKLARLSLDAELGWIYFTYFTNPTKRTVAASRFNYLVNSLQPLISYAGAGDPWTRPSFVLDLQDNLLFWTSSGSAMRAVTNGAQSKEITPYGARVTALAYDQIRKNISLISLTTKGDYYTYDLYTINVDGSYPVKVGQIAQWSYRSYSNMAIITSYDGLVFVGYDAYDMSSTQRNVIALFMKGVGQPLTLWSGDDKEVGIITDLIYDHKSRSLVWITVLGQIWKGQLNSNNTKLMDAKILLNDASIDEGITLTQSGCDFNCFLNGACDESTKTCSCAPNYYPSSTCQTFCTREDTCSGHGSCSSTDGSCICDLNWEGSKCDQKKKSPPIFPNAFIAQNVTFSGPSFGTATATVSMNQPLQMERIDWSNGTITILRYDLGFRFDLFKGSCNTSILSGALALFRVPANAVLKGTVQCSAPTQCNEWWSESAKQTYYTTKDPTPGVDAELPVMIKDYTTDLQTSYSVLLFKSVVPEKSLFDFPTICIPKI